jgi:putative signal transducing protein
MRPRGLHARLNAMPHQPTVIYSAANTQQAYLLKGILEDRGIPARVVNDAIQIAGGDLPVGWAAAARVVVISEDALKAREIAEEFDRTTGHEPTSDAFLSAPAAMEWSEWPVCPQCGERRTAHCPFCGASGSTFPLADMQDDPNGTQVLLYCNSCDDHFRPDWYRLCHRCGLDYGTGLVPEPPTTSIEWNLRSIFVVAAMIACVLAFGAYFYWLFSGGEPPAP